MMREFRKGDLVRITPNMRYNMYEKSLYKVKRLYTGDSPSTTGLYLSLVEGVPFHGDTDGEMPWRADIFELALPEVLPTLESYE